MTAIDLGDGRSARSARTREAVVDALLALHAEGDLSPPARRVAARAGVALRTVYGHFSDLETLYAEAGERQRDRHARAGAGPRVDLPLATRVEAFCAARATQLEALLPVMRASRLREPFSARLATNRARHVASAVAEVGRVFAAELATEPDGGGQLREALVAATSPAVWEALRSDRGLGPGEAAEVLRRTVTALLTPGGPP